jgi:hypothetical protein
MHLERDGGYINIEHLGVLLTTSNTMMTVVYMLPLLLPLPRPILVPLVA